MNCPACDKEVKVLPDKPNNSFYAVTSTVDMNSANDAGGILTNVETPVKETYKCCSEKCWVTRIEVDWGQS